MRAAPRRRGVRPGRERGRRSRGTWFTAQCTAAGARPGPEYLGGKLDHRADLWAAGIIMYELLTSRRLFDGPDAFETMKRVRELPIPRPSLANPSVTHELDDIVMTALERDPRRRWQLAQAMRDRIHAVIAQPGNATDNQGVIDWVNWVFEQKPGRAPQLTPIVPIPVQVPSSATSDLAPDMVDEAAARAAPATGTFTWTLPTIVWTACACLLVLLLLGSLIWTIVG